MDLAPSASMWIADTEHCRRMDRRATEEFGVPAMVLMERAGAAVFDAVRELLPEGGGLAVVCGRGNNGGDGFVLARLAIDHGYAVDCLVTADDPGQLRDEARQQMLQAQAQGIVPIFRTDARWPRRMESLACRDLIVDGILGIGASGDLHGSVAEAVDAINRSGVPVLSIDVPSGIDSDTGEEPGASVWALRTVTFGLPKPYLFQGIGLEHAGYWTVADIGFPSELLREATGALLIDDRWVADLLPERLRSSHKGDNGSVLIIAGSGRMRGAAVLAATSAVRAGAGLVTVAAVESVCAAVIAGCPEAVLLPLPEVDGVIAPEGADLVLADQHRHSAALFGPGLTHGPPVAEFLSRLWERWETPSCVDADALNAVGQGLTLPPAPCLLTPHPGEMSRLLRSTVAEVQSDRFETVRSAAARFGKSLLLKGPYSIVAAPGEVLLVNSTGNPGMASAGMGDVLSGVATALIGQELPPYFAGACAMYWHGLAGDLCAQDLAPIGYTASDVAAAIPRARAKLVASCSER